MSETPTLHQLADHFGSDKGFGVLNAHGYTRVYEALLAGARTQPLRVLEIGLMHPLLHAQARSGNGAFAHAPSLQMWAEYLPQGLVAGFDIEDFSGLRHPRIRTWWADQADRASLQRAAQQATQVFGGAFDLIIDDGSHSSAHQQITLAALLPFLQTRGLYVIEDLHYQPPHLEMEGVCKTRDFLRALCPGSPTHTLPTACTEDEVRWLRQRVDTVLFFDSLDRDRPHPADSMDALAVIRCKGT